MRVFWLSPAKLIILRYVPQAQILLDARRLFYLRAVSGYHPRSRQHAQDGSPVR